MIGASGIYLSFIVLVNLIFYFSPSNVSFGIYLLPRKKPLKYALHLDSISGCLLFFKIIAAIKTMSFLSNQGKWSKKQG